MLSTNQSRVSEGAIFKIRLGGKQNKLGPGEKRMQFKGGREKM